MHCERFELLRVRSNEQSGATTDLHHHVQACTELRILELSKSTETGLHEGSHSPFIGNRRPDACNQHEWIRSQPSQKQLERFRTKATTEELRLADEQVDVHEAPWKVGQACGLQFVRWWCLPTDVAGRGPVGLNQRTIPDRPSQRALQRRLRISPPASHVRPVQPIPEHRRVSAGSEGLESDLEWEYHDQDAA